MEFKEGIYEDLDYQTYDSIPAWRSHDLTTIIKCPYTWKNQAPNSESPALLEGRVQHTCFLEHHKFDLHTSEKNLHNYFQESLPKNQKFEYSLRHVALVFLHIQYSNL